MAEYKYDVFISYSRKDTKIADKICEAFYKAGITYFIDRVGISGGVEHPEMLVQAIRESKVFLFLASKNAYESKFTPSEIVYAFKKSKNRTSFPTSSMAATCRKRWHSPSVPSIGGTSTNIPSTMFL
jgi:hypothetical protein